MPKVAGSQISLFLHSLQADALVVPFMQAVLFRPQIPYFSFIPPIASTGQNVWVMNTTGGKKFLFSVTVWYSHESRQAF
jgi:hypothetical protein